MEKGNALRTAAMLLTILFCAIFILTFGVLLAPEDEKLKELAAQELAFNDGWTLVDLDGSHRSVTLPVDVPAVPNTPVSIYRTLGSDFDDAMCLSFVNHSQTIRIAIGDKVIYEDKVKPNQRIGKTPPPGRSIVRLGGDNVGKTLTFTFSSPHDRLGGRIDAIRVGTCVQLFFAFCKEYFPRLLCDLIILGAGIFLIILGFSIRNAMDLRKTSVFIGSFAVLFASFLRYGTASFPLLYFDTFYSYMTGLLSLMLCALPLTLYYREKVSTKLKPIFLLLFWGHIVNIAVVLLLQLLQVQDLVESLVATHILLFLTIISIVLSHWEELRLRKTHGMAFENVGLLAMILFCCLDLMQYYINSMFRLGFFSRLGMVCYLICMVTSVVRATNKREDEYRRNQQQIREMETRLLLSQLSPHFTCNSLTSIRYLCQSDTDMAVQTIDVFSDFLRGTLESLGKKQMIPFAQDLKHLRSYLAVEQVRFGALLQVEFDIETEDFTLPALTLQPLAENAVRHGITKRDEGGVIWIATHQEGEETIITIRDDGVGFDPQQIPTDDGVHVGLTNVRKRIELMCGGTLQVCSIPDAGTTITIRLPERGAMDEHIGN